MDGHVEINKDPWDEEPTELYVENVKSYQDSDDTFFTELRVLNGPQKGQLKSNLWFKYKRDGAPRKDTSKLMESLGLQITDHPSALKGKAFKSSPWYPTGQKYPVFTKIEELTIEDPF